MTRPGRTFAGTGSAQQERRERELLRVLGGDGEAADRAVRLGELDRIISAAIAGDKAASRVTDPRPEFVADFAAASRRGGAYRWQFAGGLDRRSSLFPPPIGNGGGAFFLERDAGVGTWLAAIASGASPDPRLFVKGTGAPKDEYSPWREVYTEGSILGTVAQGADGVPQGALWQEVSNANGRAVREASGLQTCHSGEVTFTRVSGDAMGFNWTYPASFAGGPQLSLILPTNAGGAFNSLGPTDIGAAYSSGGTTTVSVGYYRSAGGTAFPVDATIVGVRLKATGYWR